MTLPTTKAKKKYDVSVIIVCRNGKKVTHGCILSLLPYPVREIIIIDNASDDSTVVMLKQIAKKDARVQLIVNSTNNGFAEANNQGARRATGKYIFFLNNDTILTEDIFPVLIKNVSSNSVAAVQPMILFPNGTIDSIGSYMTPTGFLYHRAHRMKPDSSFLKIEPVYTLKGAAMLWKKSVLDEIGLLDESYFAYFEETELCHRAFNAGYEVHVVPSVQITHLGGFTSNSMDAAFIQYYNTKNRMVTYLKHCTFMDILTIFFLHALLTQLLAMKLLLSSSWKVGVSVEKGFFAGVTEGVISRLNSGSPKRDISVLKKYPDIHYYSALFSSLQNYRKIW